MGCSTSNIKMDCGYEQRQDGREFKPLQAKHLVRSYLWVSPSFLSSGGNSFNVNYWNFLPFLRRLANHPGLLQPNLPLSSFQASFRKERRWSTHSKPWRKAFQHQKGKRMIQDLMTALLSSSAQSARRCSCAIWNFRRSGWSGDYILQAAQVEKLRKTGMNRSWLVQVWTPEDSRNFSNGFWTKMVK